MDTCHVCTVRHESKEERMMRIDRIKLLVEMSKKDMNQRKLSKASGVSTTTINGIMSGRRCADKTGYKIAVALGIDVTKIMESRR